MVLTIERLLKKYINLKDSPLDVEKFIKTTKKKAESLGYTFVEKEQEYNMRKYGEDRVVKIFLDKEFDVFSKVEINIECYFERMEKSKNKFNGNAQISFVLDLKYDYRNKWAQTRFMSFVFHVYTKMLKWHLENKYLIPAIIEGNEIYDHIKNEFETY